MKGGCSLNIKTLIEQIRLGNHDLFEPLVRTYQQKIFGFCYYMLGHRQEAEDAVQDIFVKAFQHLESYRYDDSFSAWLHKIAANHCKTLIKRKKKWSFLMPLLDFNLQAKSAEQVYEELAGTELAICLVELTPAEKEIIILRVLEDQSFDEIANFLGEKPATIRKRFERLKKKIRNKQEKLEDKGYEKRFSN
jgi:RNA polymerase sigma-70 factor, ECF subfamily